VSVHAASIDATWIIRTRSPIDPEADSFPRSPPRTVLASDLMSVGCRITSAIIDTGCEKGPRSDCASSYATPLVASAAALARQALVEGRLSAADPAGIAIARPGPSGALLSGVVQNPWPPSLVSLFAFSVRSFNLRLGVDLRRPI
jgi:hypothetical protein